MMYSSKCNKNWPNSFQETVHANLIWLKFDKSCSSADHENEDNDTMNS